MQMPLRIGEPARALPVALLRAGLPARAPRKICRMVAMPRLLLSKLLLLLLLCST
jgi:hypothetical protein